MKAILLCLLPTFSLFTLTAQDKQKDSIATEISTLEKIKSEIGLKVDQVSEELTELFSIQQTMKNKIQELDEVLEQNKSEFKRLEAKNELTSIDRKKLEAYRKIKSDRNKLAKSIAEHDVKSNRQLAVLDQTIGIRNELDEKIQQLKAQYASM